MNIEQSPILRLLVATIASVGVHAYVLTIPLAQPPLATIHSPAQEHIQFQASLSARTIDTNKPTFRLQSRPEQTIIHKQYATPEDKRTELTDGIQIILPEPVQYWPRLELSQAPTPQQPILFPYPEDAPSVGKSRAVIALYVNENGFVDKVEIESSDLPVWMLTDTLSAFRNTSFFPGQKDGIPVKSRIRIEVLFDSGND